MEGEARQALVSDGCPPCYPASLELPPEKSDGIISYWQSIPGTGNVVLCAQLSDWKSFRNHQRRLRRQCLKRRSFPSFLEDFNARRRIYGFRDTVCLSQDLDRQSRLQNWTEFQSYHLEEQGRLDQETETLRRDLLELRSEDEDKLMATERLLHMGYQKSKQHSILLQWIDQQRNTIAAEQALPVTSSRRRQGRSLKAHSPLRPIPSAVSKISAADRPKTTRKSQPGRSTRGCHTSATAAAKTILEAGSSRYKQQSPSTLKTRSGREIKRPRRFTPS